MELSKFRKCVVSITTFIIIIILNSCDSHVVSPSSGEVRGQIKSMDNSTSVSGIKMYLLNIAFKVDTVNISNNKKAILDSAITDEAGKYGFANLPEGKYAVVAAISNQGAFINYDNSSPDSYKFEINEVKQTFTVNFIRTYLPMDGGNFQIVIKFKNFKALEGGWWYISSGRRYEYFLYYPMLSMTDRNSWVSDYNESLQSITYTFPYGTTTATTTLTNKIYFFFSEVSLDAAYKNVYRNSYNIEYDFTQNSCPATSTFEYDWAAHTFNKIQ